MGLLLKAATGGRARGGRICQVHLCAEGVQVVVSMAEELVALCRGVNWARAPPATPSEQWVSAVVVKQAKKKTRRKDDEEEAKTAKKKKKKRNKKK